MLMRKFIIALLTCSALLAQPSRGLGGRARSQSRDALRPRGILTMAGVRSVEKWLRAVRAEARAAVRLVRWARSHLPDWEPW
jgi:hypothetical protein